MKWPADWGLLIGIAALMLLVGALAPAADADYTHIKLFENIFTGTESDIPFIQEKYDVLSLYPWLVVPYKDAGGEAPCWVYAQYHTVTQAQLGFYRDWAETNGAVWEDLFVHFAVDTTYRPAYYGGTADSSREDRFDAVWVNDGTKFTDRTNDAYSGAAFALGSAINSALYLGYQERFREINVSLATAASGWTGIWEYWNGSSWAGLAPTDGTLGMTKSGKVGFAPATDWVRHSPSGIGKEMWWVRLRTTAAGTTRPVVAGGGLKGRNYITFADGYYRQPGWDSVNDTNGDGVRDSNNNPSATAVFRYESRAYHWELMHSYVNMGNARAREAVAAFAVQLVNTAISGSAYIYDAIFYDVACHQIALENVRSGGTTIEDTSDAAWRANTVLTLREAKAAVGPGKLIFLNTSMDVHPATELFIDEVDGFLGEKYIHIWMDKTKARIEAAATRSAKGKYCLMHADGWATVNGDLERDRIYSLATFYLTKSGNTYYRFGFDGTGPDPKTFRGHLYGAIEYDIGQPKAPYYVLHQEDDPSCPHDNWGIAYVFAREFDRALALSCPRPDYDSNFTASYTLELPYYEFVNGSGQTVASNRYQRLASDGTLVADSITQITLRNAEGAILIKSDINPPDLRLTKMSAMDTEEALPGVTTVTYRIEYENQGAETLVNVVLMDEIPQHTTYVSGTARHNGVTIVPDPYADGRISLDIGTLAPGEGGYVEFDVTLD